MVKIFAHSVVVVEGPNVSNGQVIRIQRRREFSTSDEEEEDEDGAKKEPEVAPVEEEVKGDYECCKQIAHFVRIALSG